MSLHVATGGALGALAPSRRAAVGLGVLLHALGDGIPHEDIESLRFEIGSGLVCLLALAARHGPLSPVVLGAAASSAPDLEHVLRLPRPGGRKLFPSHRIAGWHREGGLSAPAQLLAAGVLVGLVLAARR